MSTPFRGNVDALRERLLANEIENRDLRAEIERLRVLARPIAPTAEPPAYWVPAVIIAVCVAVQLFLAAGASARSHGIGAPVEKAAKQSQQSL